MVIGVTKHCTLYILYVPDFSDYKEHKLTEENVGFKLLQKAGWTEGSGLGVKEDGITAPINK